MQLISPRPKEPGNTGEVHAHLIDAHDYTGHRFLVAELEELDREGRCVITDHSALVVFNLVGPSFIVPATWSLSLELSCEGHPCIRNTSATVVLHSDSLVLLDLCIEVRVQ